LAASTSPQRAVREIAVAHSEDTVEGPNAFTEKRKLNWKRR